MFNATTHRGQRGFTLIEVMIVVAVIAILALILIPNFTSARAQAQTATCESNLREIATAAELYYSDAQAYPSGGNVVAGAFLYNGTNYLDTTPVDPAAPTNTATQTYPYVFVSTAASGGTAASYTITCPGSHAGFTLSKLTPASGAVAPYHTILYDSSIGLETQ